MVVVIACLVAQGYCKLPGSHKNPAAIHEYYQILQYFYWLSIWRDQGKFLFKSGQQKFNLCMRPANERWRYTVTSYHISLRIILCMSPANERWCYTVTSSLIEDHSVYEPSQWEMALHYNVISHWLGANTEWSLWFTIPVHQAHGSKSIYALKNNLHMPCQYLYKPCKADIYCCKNKHMPTLKSHLPSQTCNHTFMCPGKDLHAQSIQAHLNVEHCYNVNLQGLITSCSRILL